MELSGQFILEIVHSLELSGPLITETAHKLELSEQLTLGTFNRTCLTRWGSIDLNCLDNRARCVSIKWN